MPSSTSTYSSRWHDRGRRRRRIDAGFWDNQTRQDRNSAVRKESAIITNEGGQSPPQSKRGGKEQDISSSQMNIEAWRSQQAIGMDLQGLLDSGPCLFSRHSGSHVGFENSLNVTDHGWQCRGIDTAQLCPAETSSPTCSFSDDDSPCPSDRWCEDSAF